MDRTNFNIAIDLMREQIDEYTDGYSVLDPLENWEQDINLVQSHILDHNRWEVKKMFIYSIGDYYIQVIWDDPATEMQSGQVTNCIVNEVEPYPCSVIAFKERRG